MGAQRLTPGSSIGPSTCDNSHTQPRPFGGEEPFRPSASRDSLESAGSRRPAVSGERLCAFLHAGPIALKLRVGPQGAGGLRRPASVFESFARSQSSTSQRESQLRRAIPRRLTGQAPLASLSHSPVAAANLLGPPAPTLEGIDIADEALAALAAQHHLLLRTWWQAAYTAWCRGALKPQEITGEDYAAMQRVMGLAMLQAMQRRWMSGAGPSSALGIPNLAVMPPETVATLQSVHMFVVTRPSAERNRLIGSLMHEAHAHIIAGEIAAAGDGSGTRSAESAEALAVTLFRAATAGALAARGMQAALFGVFWQMLKNHSVKHFEQESPTSPHFRPTPN